MRREESRHLLIESVQRRLKLGGAPKDNISVEVHPITAANSMPKCAESIQVGATVFRDDSWPHAWEWVGHAVQQDRVPALCLLDRLAVDASGEQIHHTFTTTVDFLAARGEAADNGPQGRVIKGLCSHSKSIKRPRQQHGLPQNVLELILDINRYR